MSQRPVLGTPRSSSWAAALSIRGCRRRLHKPGAGDPRSPSRVGSRNACTRPPARFHILGSLHASSRGPPSPGVAGIALAPRYWAIRTARRGRSGGTRSAPQGADLSTSILRHGQSACHLRRSAIPEVLNRISVSANGSAPFLHDVGWNAAAVAQLNPVLPCPRSDHFCVKAR